MRFIKESDYTTILRDEIKNILLEDYTEVKLFRAEDMAISQMKNYLGGRYDTDIIFTSHDDDDDDPDPRDAYIIMIAMDCTIYHLYTSLAPDKIPSHRAERYQDAVDWLKLAGKGAISTLLPLNTGEDGNTLFDFRISSEYKNEDNRW